MEIVAAHATHLFIGSEEEPRQVVRVRVVAAQPRDEREPWQLSVRGDGVATEHAVVVGPLSAGEEATFEIGIILTAPARPGATIHAEAVLETGSTTVAFPFELAVAEPGWRMFMISHFHYDPVWWNTQAAYTESWAVGRPYRMAFQEPGLALVKAHLETARRDPDYKFVLAELDYLKPYWAVYPEDRSYIRQLLDEGRLELMGGTYNEPNTNLTSAESTIRNAIYGVGYQRDVLGGAPATAWQLDAFGHDPQFPGIMADAGLTSSSWARGPFHEWGPRWVRGSSRLFPQAADPAAPRMQFASEFEWVAPSGRGLLTCFMANHYSAGWWMDSAITLEEAEAEVNTLFTELQAVAATKNVLLPVGTDYTPPNRWLTAIHRDWNRRYVWPKFMAAIPREFFDAVRAERAVTGRGFSPQTRDMNPIYTGKDVSFIDTKQAQRLGENILLSAEKFSTVAALLGARYPTEAIDKAWRQLLFGAHHDGITGSESDQVYLDLLGGWREAYELASAALDGALRHLGRRIGTAGDGLAVTIFNALSWPRTDVVRTELELEAGRMFAVELQDDAGAVVPCVLEAVDRHLDGSLARVRLTFIATRVPALGYRTYRAVPATRTPADAAWEAVATGPIENERYVVEVDIERGGAIVRLLDRGTGKQLLAPDGLGNELLAYREYPNHPHFGEGPWHLTPDGTAWSSAGYPAQVTVERCAIGSRIRVTGPFAECSRSQEIVLWDGIERVEFNTGLDGFAGQDRLFRVRFGAAVEGGTPIAEVGNAVVGRPFGFPSVDVAEAPFTLDNPAFNWFGLGATARLSLVSEGGVERAARATTVAEVIVPGDPAHDDAVRALVVALVRQGVTSTLSRHDASRYGTLVFDSNLPDLRVAVGAPSENSFTTEVLREAGERYAAEVQRQLRVQGWARVWVPAERPLSETWRPKPDLRGSRDLPVLIVAGIDRAATVQAITAVADDLADGVIVVNQPAELDGTTGQVEDYTIGLLNRGTPGFNVEPDGNLYLSLLRACSGWPSGVWIDPPRRTVPDGSNFQFEHWSHTFEYALVAGRGDWRTGELVRAGHEYNNPLTARVLNPHAGDLPATTGFAQVEPASVVLTALKPAGNPMASMSGAVADAVNGITFRLYESAGRPTTARIRFMTPLHDAVVTNALEEETVMHIATPAGDELEIELDPYQIVTVRGVARPVASPPRGDGQAAPPLADLAPRREVAQPVFSDYWMHNKGPAPMGYQPVTVQIRPSHIGGRGPFTLPVAVACERTDAPVAGTVTFVAPAGWQVTPEERIFRLAPGAHLGLEVTAVPAPEAAPGRYFVAARISDDAGQTHEDVVTIDYRPDHGGDGAVVQQDERSPLLTNALERATHAVLPWEQSAEPIDPQLGGELTAELVTNVVRVASGERSELSVELTNGAYGEIRGEAQLISPYDTWPFSHPWTQGFAIGPGERMTIGFTFSPTLGAPPGTYWALVKVMYFGRLIYTEAVTVEVLPAARDREPLGADAAAIARSSHWAGKGR